LDQTGRLLVPGDQSLVGGKWITSIIDDDAHLADLLQGFDAVVDIQFFVDVLQVGLDGHRCDINSCGNFLVAQSLSQQRKNFDFTFGANIAKAKQLKPKKE